MFELLEIFAVQCETEQLTIILSIGAKQSSLGDGATLDQLGEADHLAQLALKIQSVAFLSQQIHIALAMIDHLKQLLNINVV